MTIKINYVVKVSEPRAFTMDEAERATQPANQIGQNIGNDLTDVRQD